MAIKCHLRSQISLPVVWDFRLVSYSNRHSTGGCPILTTSFGTNPRPWVLAKCDWELYCVIKPLLLAVWPPIGSPKIGSPIIVPIWNVVFANKSRKLGRIWMKLGRWGWGLKRLSPARFQQNRSIGFRESAKKWVAEALFFCDVNDAPLLPLSLDRFPPNFPRTRVQVASREKWFHIPEKFLLSGRISQKNRLYRVL